MNRKYFIQDKLKYIFSNNNILADSLNFCKNNNVDDRHLDFIKLSVNKFLSCRDISKGFVKFKCPLPICFPLPVNLSCVLPADTSTLWPGLKIFRNIF